MAELKVDLLSTDSMRTAQAVIEQRLRDLAVEERDQAEKPATAADEIPPERVAADLWGRIGEGTRGLVNAFADSRAPVTLREVAEAMGEPYDKVKARKFRFGRTENLINDTWGVELLPASWDHERGANRYVMNPAIAAAIRAIRIRSESERQ